MPVSATERSVVAIVVLYNPPFDIVDRMRRFAMSADRVVAVLNGCLPSVADGLHALDRIRVVSNPKNVGLGAALNQGLEIAFGIEQAAYVLLFDQDSDPPARMGFSLRDLVEQSNVDASRIAAVAPVLRDIKGVKGRVGSVVSGQQSLVAVPTLATSGALISAYAYKRVGPMRSDLFIDCLDHEWSFRAADAGLSSFVVSQVAMPHDMGDDGFTVLGRYRPIHRSPIRHYYITRNTLWLVRQRYVPRAWARRESIKIVPRILAYCLFSHDRRESILLIWQGVRDGLAGRLGPLSSRSQI